MRFRALILIGMAVPLLLSPVILSEEVSQPCKEAEEAIKRLSHAQKEQIATLKEVVEECFLLAKSNRVEIVEVLEARVSLLKVELDAAKKVSDRIALCKEALESLKEYDEMAQKRFEASRGSPLNILKVKAGRLEIEIILEQAKIEEANHSK